jgi:hypothetical protein
VQLDAVADELYGLPLDDFTETRKLREKQAREAGDEPLAGEIHALSKPNLAAWLVNQLVRADADEIQSLMDLGSRLREATANRSGDVIRDLSQRQRRVIGGLVRLAERRADAVGRKVSGEVARSLEETLHSASADPEAAERVAAGRITSGLRATGFGGTERATGGRPPGRKPPSGNRRTSTRTQPADKDERERERRTTQMAKAVSQAEVAAGEARTDLEEAEQVVTGSSERVERLARSAYGQADRAAEAARRRFRDMSRK